jgi:hypothetical protein
MLRQGLLSGGGVGEALEALTDVEIGTPSVVPAGRLVYDLLFFVMVTIGLLNMVFGIMIDTFGKVGTHEQRLLFSLV